MTEAQLSPGGLLIPRAGRLSIRLCEATFRAGVTMHGEGG